MGRPPSRTITDAEQRVLGALWRAKEGGVADVQAILNEEDDFAYTTVQTMLGVLCDKGYASRKKKGRAYIYRPLVTEASARKQATGELLARFFGGSPEALALHLIEQNDLDPKELATLGDELTKAAQRGRKK